VIKVAFLYKPASVTAYGTHAVLDDASFLDPNNLNDDKNRAAVAQTFMDNSNGALFTAVVNHLKSKGSGCGAGDDDPEQGSCNLTRTLAAGVLADWIQTDPTNSGDEDFFVIGDLNSYDKEDPIDTFRLAGYSDLIFDYQGEYAYSYVFSGQWGYLDYIMANQPAAAQVTGTTVWHINADEPDILDYDTRFNPVALYEDNAFRSSDHDPVITGIETVATPVQALRHAVATLEGLLPTGDKKDDKAIEKALESFEDALNPAYWIDDTHLTDEGQKAFGEGKKALQDLMRVSDADLVAETVAAIVEAFAVVADTAIQDAIAAGGDPWYIDRALDEMAAAAALVADGDFDQAIDRYKKAWMDAQKAIAAAPERFATYNASMNRFNAGDLVAELSVPGSDQPNTIAEIVQRNRPDVLLINEFDYDADGMAAQYFQENYLALPQNGADPIFYPYWYVAPSNTGIASGFDLDNNGSVGGPNDAFGFGFHEGQYGMVVYSMYPIDYDKIRTFQTFLWKDMPGALLPEYEDGTPWFTEEELEVVRLSSKSHWDIPVTIGSDKVHFLVSHPTPPVFDGPEDRNGTRNHDEIRFWADYINGESYIYDDDGGFGGLTPNAQFVIAGDQNSDPFDGDSIPGSAQLLLDHALVNTSITPASLGGVEQSDLQGQANDTHLGDPAFDTADFNSASPGNLRVDYVLPRVGMTMLDAGVYWPLEADPYFHLVGTFPFPSSDHKLVWIDLDLN
ncbi:MAG: endonuclease/exonuclease/phosphatase family protein, partial [Acidimicrobiia bacterium]